MSADDPTLWLEPARRDLRSARRLADPDDPIIETAVFHLQQAAEKLAKALLIGRRVRVLEVHDVPTLPDLTPSSDPLRSRLLPLARSTTFATAYRYPGVTVSGPMPTPAEVDARAGEIEGLVPLVEAVCHRDGQA